LDTTRSCLSFFYLLRRNSNGEYQSAGTVPFEAKITGVAVSGSKLTLTFAPLKGYIGNAPANGTDESYDGLKNTFM